MPIKTKFKESLESDTYKHFVFDEGQTPITTFIKVEKNDNFEYLFSKTYYSGSHIERDDNLSFCGMYCKKDGQIYCAYNHFKRLFPEIDENKGQYQMADEVQRYTSGKVGYDT